MDEFRNMMAKLQTLPPTAQRFVSDLTAMLVSYEMLSPDLKRCVIPELRTLVETMTHELPQ